MCVCESATEKGAADSLESAVTRLAYRQGHTQRSAAPFLIIDTAARIPFTGAVGAIHAPFTAAPARCPLRYGASGPAGIGVRSARHV